MKPITVGNNVVAEFDIAGGDTLGDEFYISEGVQVLLAVTSGSASVALEVSVDRAVWVPGGLTMTAAGIYNSLVRGVWGRFRATGAAFVASVTVRSLATREAETQATSTAATRAHNSDPAAHLNIVRRTLTGNLTLTAADSPQQRIIPDSDRDVVLPAEGTSQWQFLLCHSGASYNIAVKRAGGTLIGTLIPGSSMMIGWDGTAIGYC